MNKRDLQEFKKILMKEKDRISKSLESLATTNAQHDWKPNTGYGIHMADAGNEEEEFEKNLMFLSQEGDTLVHINDSLKKIESGSYGVCERCEIQIPKERLIAKPFAKYCITCRTVIERGAR